MILIAVLEFRRHACRSSSSSTSSSSSKTGKRASSSRGNTNRQQHNNQAAIPTNTHEATATGEIEPNAPHNVECMAIQVYVCTGWRGYVGDVHRCWCLLDVRQLEARCVHHDVSHNRAPARPRASYLNELYTTQQQRTLISLLAKLHVDVQKVANECAPLRIRGCFFSCSLVPRAPGTKTGRACMYSSAIVPPRCPRQRSYRRRNKPFPVVFIMAEHLSAV